MEEEDLPPFWLQSSSNPRRRLQRQASSIFLNSGVLLVVLLVVSFVFVSVVVPSLINFTSQVFRPSLIKKSWDSLNLVLVLFAVVCAFLGRNSSSNNNGSSSPTSTSYYNDRNVTKYDDTKSSSFYPSTPNRWCDHDHHQAQDGTANYNSLSRLRNFNSYPDLRQESIERWRFYDDTNLNSYSFSRSDDQNQELSKKQELENEQKENVSRIKDVDDDTSFIQKKVVYYPPSPPPPPPPPRPPSPPPQSSKAVRRKVKRTREDLGHRRSRSEEVVLENTNNIYIAPPLSPPPRPLPPPPMYAQSEKKKGNDFLNSLRRKKKKQRQRSVENFDSLFLTTTTQSSKSASLIPPPSPPPPPPPPPPPHFFQTIFKKGKTKKLIPPPPPPPPPFHVSRNTSQNLAPPLQSRPSRTMAQTAPITSHKPSKAARTSSLNSVEENVESGNSSPRIPIPPPPPPPPFKMPAWKFVLDGDYVRVGSFNSSRSGSPDLDSVEDAMSEKEHSPMASKDPSAAVLTPMFCPSPDVNTKAENFIARFRAGLTFEKMDSLKGKSNLGPVGSTG